MKTLRTTARASLVRPREAVSRGASPAISSSRAMVRQILHAPRPQAKLAVGAPDDVFEREADQVADRVMRMPEPAVQRMCAECREKREGEGVVRRLCSDCEEEMQAKEEPGETPSVPEGFEPRFAALRGGGKPLPASERAFFEPRFGRDLSHVRVHSGPAAGELARSVHARAFTLGDSIVLGSGEGGQAGRHLLAHELTHVVQQGGGAPSATIRRTVEREGGEPQDWGAALSCGVHEMFDDPDAFNAHSPPWSCCSDMALAEIRRHFETAAAYTGRVIERMERRVRMDSAIRSHFGPLQSWSYDTILDNLRRIQPLLRVERHDILCRPYGSPVIGCAEEVGGTADTNAPITLCVDSPDTETGTPSGEPGETRFVHGGWVTVLHEVVHVSGIGDLPVRRADGGGATAEEEARGEVETYHWETGASAAFPYPGPFSLRNADSYARFVEEVGSESWAEDAESGWRWVPQPGIMTGGILTPGFVQPVIAARLTMTGIGPGLQYVIPTFGVSGVWVPGVGEPRGEATPGVEPQTRAFVGVEPGLRVGVPGKVSFVFDVTTGVGARWSGPSMEPEFALYPRIAPSLRFGSPSVGGNLGIDFGRLFTFADEIGDEWILGLSGGIHWGGSASGTR